MHSCSWVKFLVFFNIRGISPPDDGRIGKNQKKYNTEIDREQLRNPPSSTGGEEIHENWEKMENGDSWRKFQHFSTILAPDFILFVFR